MHTRFCGVKIKRVVGTDIRIRRACSGIQLLCRIKIQVESFILIGVIISGNRQRDILPRLCRNDLEVINVTSCNGELCALAVMQFRSRCFRVVRLVRVVIQQ